MKKYSGYFSGLGRTAKVVIQLGIDGLLVLSSFLGAMLLRLETLAFLHSAAIWSAIGLVALGALVGFYALGVYRTLVRFVTGKILTAIAKGVLIAAISLYVVGAQFEADIPRSVPIIFGVLSFLLIGGARFLVRYFFRHPVHFQRRPVIIYGAGDSGRELLNSLLHGREYAPVALVDDDAQLHGLSVLGTRIFDASQIPRLIDETGAQVILLAIPNISRARRREIIERLEGLSVEIKTIPSISEIVSGKARVSELRSVTAEDLLGRDPVAPDRELLGRNITGRVVMVSGAGGSIGSELCRQILSQEPRILVLFEASEFALYSIDAELTETAASKSDVKIVPILGSVQNSRLLQDVIASFGVQTIYHAAAYKHVPLLEDNVIEGIRNNVFGTLAIASAAKSLGVENFILISTDKAVRPTNIMGASKRIAELICQGFSQQPSSTIISMVRFGNVLGSSGSVIPRFRAQIEAGGPVTVTHQDITRYFMTIPEAAQLVIQAGAMGKGGDVFVLDMGDPVRILDVASGMVKLHGLIPYMVEHPEHRFPEKGDIPICVTGLRKGEKLYEELLIGNNPCKTLHPRIMTASETALSNDELMEILERLRCACDKVELPTILEILKELPLDYQSRGKEIVSWATRSANEIKSDPATKLDLSA